MTLKTRILSAIIGIGVLPLLVASGINYYLTSAEISETLKTENSARLTAMRAEKANAISVYLDNLNKLLHTLARNQSIRSATQLMTSEFSASLERAVLFDTPTNRDGLENFFVSQFGEIYQARNPEGDQRFGQQTFNQLDEAALFYQSRYIADNPNPLGQKDQLVSLEALDIPTNGYDILHARFHEELRFIQQEYGFYDLFLVDNDGRVIYSVFKETDFATSLMDGPFAKSGLAQAWNEVNGAADGKVVMTDFKPYSPSYEAPASFLSTPIYDGDKQLGTLIVQLPVALFTEILTSEQRWEEVGMGETGQVYLIGPDRTFRTEPRTFLQRPQEFEQALRSTGRVENALLDRILSRETTVGLLPLAETGIDAALRGESGVVETDNYLGRGSLIAYAPLELAGMRWGIVSQIDTTESYAGLQEVQRSILTLAASVLLIMIVLAVGFGLFIASRLVNPIKDLVTALDDIAEGEGDLTVQLDSAKRKDEIGDLSRSFNTFVGKIRAVVSDVAVSATQLAGVSNEFALATEESRAHISHQREMAQSIASAVTEFAASIDEVARTSNETLVTMNQANDVSQAGSQLALKSRDEIERLSEGTRQSSDAIAQLSGEIDQIKEVLNVINDIAEQTSLLALNAAIEAARAGEQGRGFAVVADEVRLLSSRTQEATVNIAGKIETLRTAADETVTRVQRSLDAAQSGIELSNQTSNGLQEISELVGEVNGMQSQVASAVTEQQAVVKDIETSILDIDNLSEITFNESGKTQARAGELLQMSESLKRLVDRFKV